MRLLVAAQPAERSGEPADLKEARGRGPPFGELDRAAEVWLGLGVTPCEAQGIPDCDRRLGVHLATVLRDERARLERDLEGACRLAHAHERVHRIGGCRDRCLRVGVLEQGDGLEDGLRGSIAVTREVLDRAVKPKRLGPEAAVRGTGERLPNEI